jgi:hypothetical protein
VPTLSSPRGGLWGALVSAAVLAPAGLLAATPASDGHPWGGGTFLDDSPLRPADELTSQCPAPLAPICPVDASVVDRRCEVVQTTELGVLGTSQYMVVRYRRSVTYGVEHHRVVTVRDRIQWLKTTKARDLDGALPADLFEDWLAANLPKAAAVGWKLHDCGEQEQQPPSCVGIEIDVPSRARRLSLTFKGERPRLHAGAMTSSDSDTTTSITRLGDLPRHLRTPLTLRPITCPEGTAAKSQPSDAGLHEWCEGTHERHGPARSWFSTGRYLMETGVYRHGKKTGRWIECDRFERCAERSYD